MKDEVIQKGKWTFNAEVTNVFDNMLERSIPNYETMRELIANIGFHYVQPKTSIIDIGCSNGLSIQPFIKHFGVYNTYKLIDISKPMLQACKEKYKGLIDIGIVDVEEMDLRHEFPLANASLILSILTLQFTPIEYRQKILNNIYASLEKGGAFLLVEKVLGNTDEVDSVLVDEYYRLKRDNAYTQEQIQAKRESLEGVLVPVTAKWNEDLLHNAGFTKIDCFWRYLNFVGWIAIK
jgi:tRNA (cmo5U34)-methyltransferase